jgi:hypothetical protein
LHTFGTGGGTSNSGSLNRANLKLMEHEECSSHQAAERRKVVPMQLIAKIERTEHPKHRQSNDLLNHLQLVRRKRLRPHPVGRNLQAILKKSDAPTHQDDLPKRNLFVLQVSVPGKGHKDIRTNQQQDRTHALRFLSRGVNP